MHELGIMMEVVKQVEQVALENQVEKVEKIVLQIGEISTVIPHFVEEVFPAATYQTMLEDTELEIEMIPANGRCKQCGEIFSLTAQKGICYCGSEEVEMLSGREFILKEIQVS